MTKLMPVMSHIQCDCLYTQPTGGSAAEMTVARHDVDYSTAVDIADLESVLSGASEVSWSSFLDWEEVDRLIAVADNE